MAPPPPAPPAPPASDAPPHRHHEHEFGRHFDVVHVGGTSGVRVSKLMLDGSDNDDTGNGFGAQLGGESERYGVVGYHTVREQSFGFIGDGSVGFEGGVGGDLAWGVRIPVGRAHGPFVRAGIRGWLLGNERLYSSFLELPQLQLGYQLLTPSTVLEVGWRVGPVLAGRYNTGDEAYRKLGKSFEAGGHAALHVSSVHFEFNATHVFENDREGSLAMIEGKLCGDAAVLRLCMDGRYFGGREKIGDVWAPLGESPQAFYGGLTVGLGHEAMGAFDPP